MLSLCSNKCNQSVALESIFVQIIWKVTFYIVYNITKSRSIFLRKKKCTREITRLGFYKTIQDWDRPRDKKYLIIKIDIFKEKKNYNKT